MSYFKIDIERQLDKALDSLADAKNINRQHIFDRNQLLETNELLREQIADLKRDLREANARLASKEIDEIIYRHLQQCAS